MIQLSPDTDTQGCDWCSGYYASDSSLIGFSHTHLSGTGAADLGDILVTAVTGPVQFTPGSKEFPLSGYRAIFDKNSEKAEPGYYSVFLKEYGILAEMTVTERTGFHRYTFPQADEAYIIVDLEHGISDRTTQSYIKVVSPTMIQGLRRSNGWAHDQIVYFVLEFSTPFISSMMVRGSSPVLNNSFAEAEYGVKSFFIFKTKSDESILVKVSLSSVDIDGAEKNLLAENPGWDFEKEYYRSFFTDSEILNGGEINFFLSAFPDDRFGKLKNKRPRSFIDKNALIKLPTIVHPPYFTDNVTSFYPSKKIALENINPSAAIFYSFNNMDSQELL